MKIKNWGYSGETHVMSASERAQRMGELADEIRELEAIISPEHIADPDAIDEESLTETRMALEIARSELITLQEIISEDTGITAETTHDNRLSSEDPDSDLNELSHQELRSEITRLNSLLIINIIDAEATRLFTKRIESAKKLLGE